MNHRPWWQIGKGPLGKPELSKEGKAGGLLFVDAQEMARILQVPVRWLYRKVRLKEIPHVKVGKYLRFEPQKVIAHCQQSSEEAESSREITPTRV